MAINQDFINTQIAKGRDKEKLNEKWVEFEDFYTKSFPEITEDKLKEFVEARIGTYFIKDTLRRGDEYEAIIIGYSRTDFGKTKFHKEALEADKLDHEKAVVEGKVNEGGQPLNRSGFNKGEPMDMNDVWEKKCIGVYRKAGSQDKFTPVTITLKESTTKAEVPFFSLVEFWANKGKGNEEKLIVSSATSKMKVVKEFSQEQVSEFLVEYFREHIKSIESLNEYVELKDPNNRNDFVVVQGNVVQVTQTGEGKSNALTLSEKTKRDNFDDIKTLTCWVDKTIPFDLSEMALDVFAVGRVGKNKDGVLNMNLYGYYCTPEYRRPAGLLPVEGPAQNEGEW